MKKLMVSVTAFLCLLMMTACGGSEPLPPEETAMITPNIVTKEVAIKTPYCDLVVSDEFTKTVKNTVTSKEPYTVTFSMISDGTELFSIVFGEETDHLLGTLLLDDKNIVVYAVFNDFDSTNTNYENYCMYQEEGINSIIQHLSSDCDFVVNEIVAWEDTSTFDIKTPVVTLKYPNKWKDKVTIDVTEDVVMFSCRSETLFDLSFVECGGTLLGTYKDTPIYIRSYQLDESAYSEDELLDLYAMQEDINVILRNLMEDSNFKKPM